METALAQGVFPSSELESATLELANACKDVLRAQDIFAVKSLDKIDEVP